MKFSLSGLALRLMAKIVSPSRLSGWLSQRLSQRDLVAAMQAQIEKWSDKKIGQAITDLKEDRLYGWGNFLEVLGGKESVLQLLENEKFLREHRRRYAER